MEFLPDKEQSETEMMLDTTIIGIFMEILIISLFFVGVEVTISPSAGSIGEGFSNSYLVDVTGFSFGDIPIQIMPLSYDQFNELGTGVDLNDLFDNVPDDAATPGKSI